MVERLSGFDPSRGRVLQAPIGLTQGSENFDLSFVTLRWGFRLSVYCFALNYTKQKQWKTVLMKQDKFILWRTFSPVLALNYPSLVFLVGVINAVHYICGPHERLQTTDLNLNAIWPKCSLHFAKVIKALHKGLTRRALETFKAVAVSVCTFGCRVSSTHLN